MALKDSYLTITQAAKEMNVSRQTISNWISEGKLSAEIIGREKLIPKDQLLAVGMDYWQHILNFHLYMQLRYFVGYKPKEINIRGLFADKPAQATVINSKGKNEYVEVIPQRNKKGNIITRFKFRKVVQFSPLDKVPEPDTEVKAEVGRWGEIVGLVYKDVSANKSKQDGNSEA